MYPDRRTDAWFAVDLNKPARLFDEAANHTQAKTAAVAGILCCEEGFQNMIEGLGWHSHPGIADRQHDIGAAGP